MAADVTAAVDSSAVLDVIDQITRRVQEFDAHFTGLEAVVRLTRSLVEADGAAIYRRAYRDRQTFSLVRLAADPAHPVGSGHVPARYDAATTDAPLWQALCSPAEDGGLVLGDQTGESGGRCYLHPVTLGSEPFGVLMLSGLSPDVSGANLASVIGLIVRIVELGIANVNRGKQFDEVFDSFPHPSFIMAADERVTAWNRANEKMTGRRAEEIIGKDNYAYAIPYYGEPRPLVPNLILAPDSQWQATYFEFFREENHINALALCPALPGGRTYLRTNTTKLFDINDRLWGIIHTVRDVTLERQMRENLERSETMYRAIADFAGVGILLVKDSEIIYANEQVEGFMGRPPGTVVFADFLAWAHVQEFSDIQVLIDQLGRSGEEPVRFTFRAERAGRSLYFNALAQLITFENEHVVYFVIDDITEQRELDRRARLNELKLFHEERLTSLGMMAAGIAHELNQPLNTIRVITDGFLYCEEKGWGMDRDELRDNIEMISRQVVRMSTVIQNIRNFAREDQNEEFIDVNVNDAIETVFSMIGRQMEAHDIQVHRSLGRDLPPVMAPANQLEQVVTNLLINARQAFDSSPGPGRCIWLETGFRDNSVFLEISDNATGIPEDHLEKIFYPFFTTKQIGKGTGLGLSICQTIIASMKGTLSASNNSRGGATFVVAIPRQERPHEYSRDR